MPTYIRSRLEQIDRELELVSEDRVVRMKRSERTRIEGDYRTRRAELVERRGAEILLTRLAEVVLV